MLKLGSVNTECIKANHQIEFLFPETPWEAKGGKICSLFATVWITEMDYK